MRFKPETTKKDLVQFDDRFEVCDQRLRNFGMWTLPSYYISCNRYSSQMQVQVYFEHVVSELITRDNTDWDSGFQGVSVGRMFPNGAN